MADTYLEPAEEVKAEIIPPQTSYSPSELMEELGLGRGMVGRYFKAYEQLEGAMPRNSTGGREISLEAYKAIRKARLLVKSQTNLSVNDAMAMALGKQAIPPVEISTEGELLKQLAETLKERDETLRQEVSELKDLIRQQASFIEEQGQAIASFQQQLRALEPPPKAPSWWQFWR